MVEIQEKALDHIVKKSLDYWGKTLRFIHQRTWNWMGGKLGESIYMNLPPSHLNFTIKKGDKRARAHITIVNFSPYLIKIDRVIMSISSIEEAEGYPRKNESLDLELSCDNKYQIEPRNKIHFTLKADLKSQSEKIEQFKSGYVRCNYNGLEGWFMCKNKSFHLLSTGGGSYYTVAEVYNELYKHHSNQENNQDSKESD